jgi:hypothetical protein
MRTILTLRNFRFLSPAEPSPLEEVAIDLNTLLQGEYDPPCEGEQEDDTHRAAPRIGPENLKKRKVETNIDPREPQKTRGICRNYRHLNDGHHPFPDEEETGMISIAKEKAFTVIPEDDCCSLKEARKSPNWPEWEHAIHTELEQLCQMGTWELVEKPVGAVAINNKFVFTKKQNKEGIITKYKARLIAKGCAQHLGHNYLKTHLPVV